MAFGGPARHSRACKASREAENTDPCAALPAPACAFQGLSPCCLVPPGQPALLLSPRRDRQCRAHPSATLTQCLLYMKEPCPDQSSPTFSLSSWGALKRVKCCCQQPLAMGMNLSPSCHTPQPPPCHPSCRLGLWTLSIPGTELLVGLQQSQGLQGSWGLQRNRDLQCSVPLAKTRIFSLLFGVPRPCLWTGGGGSPGTVVGTVTVWELGGDSVWPLWDTMEIWDVCYH